MTGTKDGDGERRTAVRGRWPKVMAAVLGAAVACFVLVWYVAIPYPWTLRTRNPGRTSLMEQRIREAAEAGDSLEIRQEWVPLDRISDNLVRAVLVAEDYRFRQHRGIDWVSLAEEVKWTGDDSFSWTSGEDRTALRTALAYVWEKRDEIRGRSTLTQQLAKNLYWGTDRSFSRKVLEFVVAGRLERKLGKDRILELYLNVVEWGPGIFGAEAAARHYFDRSASQLTLDQASALAGTLPHPLTSNPAYRPGRMLWRKDLILTRLDPAAGIPAAPMPLPDPTIELPPPVISDPGASSLPADSAPPSDTASAVIDTSLAAADTSGAVADTMRAVADTSRGPVGTAGLPADTLRGPVTTGGVQVPGA